VEARPLRRRRNGHDTALGVGELPRRIDQAERPPNAPASTASGLDGRSPAARPARPPRPRAPSRRSAPGHGRASVAIFSRTPCLSGAPGRNRSNPGQSEPFRRDERTPQRQERVAASTARSDAAVASSSVYPLPDAPLEQLRLPGQRKRDAEIGMGMEVDDRGVTRRAARIDPRRAEASIRGTRDESSLLDADVGRGAGPPRVHHLRVAMIRSSPHLPGAAWRLGRVRRGVPTSAASYRRGVRRASNDGGAKRRVAHAITLRLRSPAAFGAPSKSSDRAVAAIHDVYQTPYLPAVEVGVGRPVAALHHLGREAGSGRARAGARVARIDVRNSPGAGRFAGAHRFGILAYRRGSANAPRSVISSRCRLDSPDEGADGRGPGHAAGRKDRHLATL